MKKRNIKKKPQKKIGPDSRSDLKLNIPKAASFEETMKLSSGAKAKSSAKGSGTSARKSTTGRTTKTQMNKGKAGTSAAAAGKSSGKATATRSRRASAERRRRVQRRRRNRRILWSLLILLIVVVSFFGIKGLGKYRKQKEADRIEAEQKAKKKAQEKTAKKKKEKAKEKATTAATTEAAPTADQKVIEQARRLVAGYDYDAGIEKIKSISGYEQNKELMGYIKQWKEEKKNLVAFSASDVEHIFYHTLVLDTTLAFECDPAIAEGFKEWMTTDREFDKITQTMYDDGWVLVSLYDFFERTEDANGTPHYKEKKVYLPAGKKPFILSIDDLSYYHTYTGHGMATKLVLDDNGKVTCEYVTRKGQTITGPYDCVPRLNKFMEEHPDGAYRGARGTIALTGYNGIFGYRTDKSYVTRENLDKDKIEWLDAHPDYDINKEIAGAKAIAEELKAEGWDFASHTWGHIRIGNANMERIKRDTEKWLANVKPIIGDTECIIFAHGQDLASSDEYDTDNNQKYKYLSSKGFHIFLNVDSNRKTMRVHDLYVHGGRRNLDGYRLWFDGHGKTDRTSDLFDASQIYDRRRKDVPEPKE